MSPEVLADVQDYLRDLDLIDGTTDWLSVRRRAHDEEDQLVILTEDGGPVPEIFAPVGIGAASMAFSNVQVRVRGIPHDGDGPRAKLAEIFGVLDSALGVEMGVTRYELVRATASEPAAFMDDKARWNFTQVFTFTWSRADVT